MILVSNFIEDLAALVKKHAPNYGICVYSPIIAQGILECDSGTSELAVNANNFHGIKYRPGRCPTAIGIYHKVGSEQNPDGTYVSSAMQWCKFPNMEAEVIGYFDFINVPRYSNLKGVTDPRTYLELIKADGYATSNKYVNNVMNVIKSYNLTRFDDEKEMDKMTKVFLSAGHGGSDPGATSYGLKEKEINLQILLSCKSELERHGLTVIASRTKDENDPVNEEVREANASGADIAVSFHTNAGGGDGSESFYYPSSADGKRLAELCEKHVKAIGQNSRGVKSGKNLRFCNGTNMTAVLCECAFVDNDIDNNIIDTVSEQKAFGVAYAKAILEYLGVPYKDKVVNKDNVLYRVQVGAYSVKENAEIQLKKLEAAGFKGFITTVEV